MKTSWLAVWLLFTGLCVHPGRMSSMPEDLDGSGDDGEGSGSGDLSEETSGSYRVTTTLSQMTPGGDKIIIPKQFGGDTMRGRPDDSDIIFDSQPATVAFMPQPTGQGSRSFLEDKETLAAVVSGGVGALVLALVLIGSLVYFMKRKEKANYAAQQTQNNTIYHKAPTKEDFPA